MRVRSSGIALSVLCALLLSASAVAQNLILNGSFETVQPAAPTDGDCATFPESLFPFECAATDWTGTYVIGNGPGNIPNFSYGIPQPDPNGKNALVLQVTDNATQSIKFPVSGEYVLTFYIANRSTSGFDGPQTVTVSLDKVLITGGTFANLPTSWTSKTLSFHATAGTHTLTFAGLGDQGNDVSAFVDDVTLQAIVATTTTLKVSTTTAPQGAPVSLTALVAAASGTTTPGGTVTFKSGTKTLGQVTLNATGQATLTIDSLAVGIDPIVAVYSGSSTFDSSTSSTVDVTITAGPTIIFTPSSVVFPATIVGTISEYQLVTVTNSGSKPLSITSIGLKGTQANSFIDISDCGTSLAVGKSCAIYVGFAPKKSGSATATLSVADNAADSPQAVTLTGTGIASPALTVTPAALLFPATAVGGSSEGQSVTLKNAGTSLVAITKISLSGADPNDFVTLNNCGADLAAGASCTVLVAFTPTAAGARAATLSVTDDAVASPQAVTLSGTGN